MKLEKILMQGNNLFKNIKNNVLKKKKSLFCLGSSLVLSGVMGCSPGAPKLRYGTLPSATFGSPFTSVNNLGSHSYNYSFFESGGLVYTKKGGHIDIDHLRGCADTTKYVYDNIKNILEKNKKDFSFNLSMEHSKHKIKLDYPKNWKNLGKTEKQKIIEDVALDVAPYVAYDVSVWHEMLTWYGVHFALIEPEFNSAFSWEDLYSNLLGAKIAVKALKHKDMNYNNAMTFEIKNQLEKLDPVSAKLSREASEKMKGKWYKGNFFVDIIKKNTDIGVDDGYVSPVLSPVIKNEEPYLLSVPRLDKIKEYGFNLDYSIKPYELEMIKVLKMVGSKDGKIHPEKDFSKIISYIEREAVEKYHYDVSKH